VERFVIDEGHTALRVDSDYGYDLVLFTYDGQGYVEPGSTFIQLKAAESLAASGNHYVFGLDIRDYNLWMMEEMPVILVLYDASQRRAHWLAVQAYFRQDIKRRPKRGARSVRVRVPRRQVVNRRAVALWRDLKWQARGGARGD
jgi:hypothetical protein